MSFVKKFNDQLDRFLSGLIDTYPSLRAKLSTYRTTINLVIKANSRKPVELFNEFVLPFKNEIINENEQFFLNQSFGEEIGGNEDTLQEAIQFKEIWKQDMTDQSRKNIFKHLKILCMLAEKS